MATEKSAFYSSCILFLQRITRTQKCLCATGSTRHVSFHQVIQTVAIVQQAVFLQPGGRLSRIDWARSSLAYLRLAYRASEFGEQRSTTSPPIGGKIFLGCFPQNSGADEERSVSFVGAQEGLSTSHHSDTETLNQETVVQALQNRPRWTDETLADTLLS